MQSEVYKYLRFAEFKSIFQWDLKRYLNKSFKSKYSIVELGAHIKDESKKYAISEEGKQYGILGVNNQTGIFDAYTEDGSKIKQKYKRMETGWIAYNPYRVNVGSIGIKKPEHKFEYISPAYVVFGCLPSLSPDYLFLVMKTPVFNKIIRDNTTGSVRQNLSYDVLKSLQIPLPTIDDQQVLVKAYNDRIQQAELLEKQADQVGKEIEEYLLKELGINGQNKTVNSQNSRFKFLRFIRFKDANRWDAYNCEPEAILKLKQSNFPLVEIGKAYNFIKRSWDKKEKEFRYVEIGSVDALNGILYAEEMPTSKAPSRATQKIKTKDLIIGTTRPYLKKFAIVNQDFNDCVCSSGFQVIAPNETNNISFLYEYLKTSPAIAQFELFMTGALYPAITNKDLRKVLIPLPTLEIQNTIVEHINKQKTQIKELKKQAEELRKEALEEFEKEVFE